jgi:hypothetical protein
MVLIGGTLPNVGWQRKTAGDVIHFLNELGNQQIGKVVDIDLLCCSPVHVKKVLLIFNQVNSN